MKLVFEQRASAILFNILSSLRDEKIFFIPSNVCPIVITTFLKAKRKIEFIDISDSTLCVDENVVLEKISSNKNIYGGLLFVRSYGLEDSFDAFFRKIKNISPDFLIIDDKCIARPSFSDIPGYADVNLYSTGYSKYVDIGWGAFAQIKDEIRYVKNPTRYNAQDLDKLNDSFRLAINEQGLFNFDLISSDWLDNSNPLKEFGEYKKTVQSEFAVSTHLKQKYNSKYTSGLPKSAQLDAKFQNWRFNIFVPEKNRLIKTIFDNKLFVGSHFKPSTSIFYQMASENSDKVYSRIINLFSDRYFPFESTDSLINIINDHLIRFQ